MIIISNTNQQVDKNNVIAEKQKPLQVGRDYRMDNFKFLLIFLVIFGHILETFAFRRPESVYRTIYQGIYLFHMPAFIFVTGYFSKKWKFSSIIYLILVYFTFQILYTQFDIHFVGLKSMKNFWTFPNWMLWYLFVVIFYKIITPVIGRNPKSILFAFAFALFIGTVKIKPVGFMAITRGVSLYPFFLIGYHWKQKYTTYLTKPIMRVGAVVTLCAVFWYFTTYQQSLHFDFLYFKQHYTIMGYTQISGILQALTVQISAILITFSLLTLTPSRKIPLVSTRGKETLAIYLLHGFVTKFYNRKGIYDYGIVDNIYVLLAISLLLVLVIGSKPVTETFNMIFRRMQWAVIGVGTILVNIVTKSYRKLIGIINK